MGNTNSNKQFFFYISAALTVYSIFGCTTHKHKNEQRLSDLFNAPNSTEADLASSVQFNNPTSQRSEMNWSQQKRKPEESMEMDRMFCH